MFMVAWKYSVRSHNKFQNFLNCFGASINSYTLLFLFSGKRKEKRIGRGSSTTQPSNPPSPSLLSPCGLSSNRQEAHLPTQPAKAQPRPPALCLSSSSRERHPPSAPMSATSAGGLHLPSPTIKPPFPSNPNPSLSPLFRGAGEPLPYYFLLPQANRA